MVRSNRNCWTQKRELRKSHRGSFRGDQGDDPVAFQQGFEESLKQAEVELSSSTPNLVEWRQPAEYLGPIVAEPLAKDAKGHSVCCRYR